MSSSSSLEEANKATKSTNSSVTSNLWESYRRFVQRNHVPLELLEAGLSRTLFWAPTDKEGSGSSRQHQNREVLYGILSLHRLAMDTALQQDKLVCENHGMSIRCSQDTDQGTSVMSPSSIRIALTFVQSLLPSIMELSFQTGSSDRRNRLRQCRVRLYLERIKFLLRLGLLGSYWRTMIQQHRAKPTTSREKGENPDTTPPLSLGIMREGGFFHGHSNSHSQYVPTVEQEDALWRRRNYVGRRTGRKVLQRMPKGEAATASYNRKTLVLGENTALHNLPIGNVSIVLGDLLYAYRPLYWANVEASKEGPSYRTWLISMAIDLISLQLCRANPNTNINQATKDELQRRKLRLLLYLLRTPLWDRWTEPTADRVESGLEYVPFLGRLLSTYFRDWLWFMKHPYEAEQG